MCWKCTIEKGFWLSILLWYQVKIALCQLSTTVDKDENIRTATKAIKVSPGSGTWGLMRYFASKLQVQTEQQELSIFGHYHPYDRQAPQVSSTHQFPDCIIYAYMQVQEAAAAGASLVVLPEMWNCPYSNDSFPMYAEDIGGGASPSADALAEAAAANAVTLVGGSIPERSNSRLYNTCLVYNREGKLLAKHRKVAPTIPDAYMHVYTRDCVSSCIKGDAIHSQLAFM